MGLLYFILIYWFGVYYGILYGLPLLGMLFRFLLFISWAALTFTGKGLYRACAALSGRDAPDDEEPNDEYGPSFDDEETSAPSDLEAAIALFGLALTLTRDELHSAYKTAIRKAHPDQGGCVELAKQLNVARDLIMSAYGWA